MTDAELEGRVRALEQFQAKAEPRLNELDRIVNGPTGDPERPALRSIAHKWLNDKAAARAVEAVREAMAADARAVEIANDASAARRDRRIAIGLSIALPIGVPLLLRAIGIA